MTEYLWVGAFFSTALVLCAVYWIFHLYPFGEKTLAWGDMKQQVIPLMMELKDIIAGDGGFLFNLQNAGGMSFWGVFFFFLSSPLTFLCTIVPKESFYDLVNVLVLLKLSLAAVSVSIFLKRTASNLSFSLHLAGCLSYALGGYGLLYYQNIVWLDVLFLFPIVILGLLQLIERGRPRLFSVSIIAFLVIQYYLSYMLMLFLLLCSALLLKHCCPEKERGQRTTMLGLSVFFSLGITAPVWLPSILQCFRSARTDGIFSALRSGDLFTQTETVLPVVLCSSAVFCFPILFRRFSMDGKSRAILVLLLLTCIPLLIDPINKLWHTGSYQAFPARYGYIPLFLSIWYFSHIMNRPGSMKATEQSSFLSWTFLFVLGGVITYFLLFRFSEITSYTATLWVDEKSLPPIVLIAILGAIVTISAVVYRKKESHMGPCLLMACVLQSFFFCCIFIGSAANIPGRELKMISLEDSIEDDGLFRVKQEQKNCDVNLLGATGFPTLNHYTSLTDRSMFTALKKLGYSSYWMEVSACCGTKISDILFSNKYRIEAGFEITNTGSGNLGYVLQKNQLPQSLPTGNRILLQDELYQSLLGEQAFTKYTPALENCGIQSNGEKTLLSSLNTGKLVYEIKIGEKETLYFDGFDAITTNLREEINDSFTLYKNGELLCGSYPTQSCNGILELGTFENETVILEIVLKKSGVFSSFGVYGLPERKVTAFKISLGNGSNLHQTGSRLTGTLVENKPESALFLSIPNLPGLNVDVNKKSVEPREVLDCFLEIPLEEGENRIVISYFPPGLLAGLIIALCMIPAILVTRIKTFRNLLNRISSPLLGLLFWGEISIIYFLPLLLWNSRQ